MAFFYLHLGKNRIFAKIATQTDFLCYFVYDFRKNSIMTKVQVKKKKKIRKNALWPMAHKSRFYGSCFCNFYVGFIFKNYLKLSVATVKFLFQKHFFNQFFLKHKMLIHRLDIKSKYLQHKLCTCKSQLLYTFYI